MGVSPHAQVSYGGVKVWDQTCGCVITEGAIKPTAGLLNFNPTWAEQGNNWEFTDFLVKIELLIPTNILVCVEISFLIVKTVADT